MPVKTALFNTFYDLNFAKIFYAILRIRGNSD